MNLNAPTEIFNEVKESFLNINPEYIDEKIRDIVMRFKNMPFFDKVCPRWSCQSHDIENSEFYIIFVTQDNGPEILYKMYENLYSEFIEAYGITYMAGNNFTVIPLVYTSGGNNCSKPFPNIQISTKTNGSETHINKCIEIWNKVLDNLEKDNYE